MIKFDISKHTCKACVICCMDFRIYEESTLHQYLAERGIKDYDLIAVPGAGKALLGKHSELILEAIRISRELHNSDEIYLIHHVDCGAYGGSKSFSSKESELANHREQLDMACEKIIAKFGDGTNVRKIFFDAENANLNAIEL